MKKTISGIRGIFGDDLTLRDVIEFCDNFGTLAGSRCVIGMDTRPSSEMMYNTAIATLLKNGIDVYSLGVAPTPVVFRAARKYDSGIVITASHNPIEWNGIKFIIKGRGINENELQSITQKQDTRSDKIGTQHNITSSYISDAIDIIGTIDNKPTIIVDVGGGTANGFANELLTKMGCKVVTINKYINSREPDPTSDSLSFLKFAAKDVIGFAFDLDADRLVVVNNGIKQSPDVTLGLGVSKALYNGYKKFVLSIDTSIAIEHLIKNNGGRVYRSKVGEANVIDLVLKTDADAGGEGSSGGFILPRFNYCRDGMLTAGLITSMSRSKFDDIISYMSKYHQIRTKISVDSEMHDRVIEDIQERFKQSYSKVDTLDGLKGIIDEDSWILVRKSNTEDIIRISAESNNNEKCQNIVNDTVTMVKDSCNKIGRV